MIRTALSLIGLTSLAAVQSSAVPSSTVQAPRTLAAYLDAHPVAASIVVAPETTRTGKGADLAAYRRKAVRLGSVTAIVPIENVRFDDDLAQPPNLYDGLPRESKVLYLMTTLDP
ncbi:hypothetical protein EON79_22655, partial [bacterium]